MKTIQVYLTKKPGQGGQREVVSLDLWAPNTASANTVSKTLSDALDRGTVLNLRVRDPHVKRVNRLSIRVDAIESFSVAGPVEAQ